MIEILTANSSHFMEEDQAIVVLQSLPPTSIRLDYHRVLDTISEFKSLPQHHSYCAISYVGLHGEKHQQTKSELQRRIQTGQILFAILVFLKGYSRKEKHAYTAPGSKAWIHAFLPEISGSCTHFIDDHKEHLSSTHILCPHIRCHLYSDRHPPLSEFLENL